MQIDVTGQPLATRVLIAAAAFSLDPTPESERALMSAACDLRRGRTNPFTGAQKIFEMVRLEAGIPADLFFSKRRDRNLSWPRMLAMYLVYKHTSLSFPQIGEAMNRDHTAVMYACRKVPDILRDSYEILEIHDRVVAKLEVGQ